jgi:hypothetical protein
MSFHSTKFETATLSFMSVFFVLAAGCVVSRAEAIQTNPSGAALLKNVFETMKGTGMAGRIYYDGRCRPGDEFSMSFPNVKLDPSQKAATSVPGLRATLKNDPRVSVEERSGVIYVKIGNASDEILRTKLSSIKFGRLAQYNEALAISAVENSTDVQRAAKNLKLRVPARAFNMILTQPAEGLPHLPAIMSNVTMDGALDAVAKTFGGIVVYGICEKVGIYEVSVVGE